MTLKSSTFPVEKQKIAGELSKPSLLDRHHSLVQQVLKEAKSFSEDRRRSLEHIKDGKLRESAKK